MPSMARDNRCNGEQKIDDCGWEAASSAAVTTFTVFHAAAAALPSTIAAATAAVAASEGDVNVFERKAGKLITQSPTIPQSPKVFQRPLQSGAS